MRNVRLTSVKYSERLGQPCEWTLDELKLWPINLIVGKNATGKTRAINLIWNLSRTFVPEPRYRAENCGYDCHFDNDGKPLRYVLQVDGGKVIKEEVHFDGQLVLVRRADSSGEIWTKTENRMIQFKPPENELAAAARRDSLQHEFLEPLHEWALAVRHYTFGSHIGKRHFVLPVMNGPDVDDRQEEQVVAIFRKGLKNLGQSFVDAIINDMVRMGYNLQKITTSPAENIKLMHDGELRDVIALAVKERGIDALVGQNEMSQGMFRALSVLIQVNYSQMAQRANCVLIDDIGEGLDFDRSTRLIELLREKALHSSFQLVMTTNDQFVMNHVPLDEWSVLKRDGCHVRVLNKENAAAQFEHFRFVGMSNFTFFEMDFADIPESQEAVVP